MITFKTEPCLTPKQLKARRDKVYQYSQKGRKQVIRSRMKYRERRAVARRIAYLERPFIAWDGEGGELDSGEHAYFILANSLGDTISNPDGIPTLDIFEFLLTQGSNGGINIFYGMGYDVNMFLRDIPVHRLRVLYDEGHVWWQGYRISWRPGKQFSLYKNRVNVRFYDILPFFQCSFVKACDQYLTEWDTDGIIRAGKARRGQFTYDEIESVTEYNSRELDVLSELATELRTRLDRAGIRIGRWDGPGAIAASLYRKNKTKEYLPTYNHPVTRLASYAYAGGRFELIHKGHSESPCYQYDINSAYPAAMRNLPCLAHGEWKHVTFPSRIHKFGIYRIETNQYRQEYYSRPYPLWRRQPDGTIAFPHYVHNWYWTPEAEIATNLGPDAFTIHEGYEWHQYCDHTPFSFVQILYDTRAHLKSIGDGAQLAYKLGLNSLYGKLCQTIGYDPGPPERFPPYHCLEWGGYITSSCRAQLWHASQQSPDDVIAFETDAIFSSVPLDLPESNQLGEWESTVYASLTYLKSGMWWATGIDGKEYEKCRGINPGTLTRVQVIKALQTPWKSLILPATQTRFIGLGYALHTSLDLWRSWQTKPKQIQLSLGGKRIDPPFNSAPTRTLSGPWHHTWPRPLPKQFSTPYDIIWQENQNEKKLAYHDESDNAH